MNSSEFRPFCGKRNTKVYKICKLRKRIFSVFYNISPPNLAITNFDMLFLAVVKDFDFFAKMKIQFKRGMVHYVIRNMLKINTKYFGKKRSSSVMNLSFT